MIGRHFFCFCFIFYFFNYKEKFALTYIEEVSRGRMGNAFHFRVTVFATSISAI
jgi:hypothetical protein